MLGSLQRTLIYAFVQGVVESEGHLYLHYRQKPVPYDVRTPFVYETLVFMKERLRKRLCLAILDFGWKSPILEYGSVERESVSRPP